MKSIGYCLGFASCVATAVCLIVGPASSASKPTAGHAPQFRPLGQTALERLFRGGVRVRLLPLGVAPGGLGREYFHGDGRFEACGGRSASVSGDYRAIGGKLCTTVGREIICRTVFQDAHGDYFQRFPGTTNPAFTHIAVEIQPSQNETCNTPGVER